MASMLFRGVLFLIISLSSCATVRVEKLVCDFYFSEKVPGTGKYTLDSVNITEKRGKLFDECIDKYIKNAKDDKGYIIMEKLRDNKYVLKNLSSIFYTHFHSPYDAEVTVEVTDNEIRARQNGPGGKEGVLEITDNRQNGLLYQVLAEKGGGQSYIFIYFRDGKIFVHLDYMYDRGYKA